MVFCHILPEWRDNQKMGERWISIRFDMWIRHESVLNNRNCYHSDNSYSCYNIDALCEHATVQAACKKKVVSNSPGLVDFAIALLNFILNLTDVQVQFFEDQITALELCNQCSSPKSIWR